MQLFSSLSIQPSDGSYQCHTCSNYAYFSTRDTLHGHCTKWRYRCQSLLYTVQCIHIFAAHNWNIICWERATATECSYEFPLCGQCYQRMSLNMYDIPWWARAGNMNKTVICNSCGHWENIVGSLPASFPGLLNLFRLHYANQLRRPEMFLPHNM